MRQPRQDVERDLDAFELPDPAVRALFDALRQAAALLVAKADLPARLAEQVQSDILYLGSAVGAMCSEYPVIGVKLDGVGSVDGDGRNLERASLADNLSELEMVPNPDQRAFEDWSDAESDDDGSDSDSE